jgi:hypothetical protein
VKDERFERKPLACSKEDLLVNHALTKSLSEEREWLFGTICYSHNPQSTPPRRRMQAKSLAGNVDRMPRRRETCNELRHTIVQTPHKQIVCHSTLKNIGATLNMTLLLLLLNQLVR